MPHKPKEHQSKCLQLLQDIKTKETVGQLEQMKQRYEAVSQHIDNTQSTIANTAISYKKYKKTNIPECVTKIQNLRDTLITTANTLISDNKHELAIPLLELASKLTNPLRTCYWIGAKYGEDRQLKTCKMEELQKTLQSHETQHRKDKSLRKQLKQAQKAAPKDFARIVEHTFDAIRDMLKEFRKTFQDDTRYQSSIELVNQVLTTLNKSKSSTNRQLPPDSLKTESSLFPPKQSTQHSSRQGVAEARSPQQDPSSQQQTEVLNAHYVAKTRDQYSTRDGNGMLRGENLGPRLAMTLVATQFQADRKQQDTQEQTRTLATYSSANSK